MAVLNESAGTSRPTPEGNSPEGRRRLLENGYEPIPVRGKRPLWDDWQEVPITPERLSEVESAYPDHSNTGLRCGHLAVVDIDLWNAEHAADISEAVCGVLGETLLRRVGQKGVALLFHNAEPLGKVTVSGKVPGEQKASRLIEVLGTGQQLAAFGIHPDTGRAYDWETASLGNTPLDTPLHELPKVTPDTIRDAASAVSKRLAELGYLDLEITESGASRDDESPKAGEPVTADMLESMLRHVDPGCDRMTWIAIAGAIKSACVIDTTTGEDAETFDGSALFIRWSAGELSEDHEPGNFKGPADCEETWKSLSTTRRGGASVGTLVFHARRGGYSGPVRVSAIERFYGGTTASGSSKEQGEQVGAKGDLGPVKNLNERYAVVTGGKNSGRIVDLSDPREPQFLTKDRFHTPYQNRRIPIPTNDGVKPMPVSALWLTYEKRRDVTDIGFEPPESPFPLPDDAHNIWRGFAIEAKEGNSHDPLLAHLFDNVCRGDEALFEWLIAWLADLVQRPGNKPGVAVALRGEFGAGKSILYEYLRRIFGRHAMKISRPEHLTGRFNAHMAGLCLLGVEEGFWAGDKDSESVLKDLITAPEVTVEQKFADPYTIHNHVHILVTSNADWVVPAAPGDRRWAVLDVSPQRKNDRAFWGPIYAALEGNGPAHLLSYLLNYRYERSILFRPPMTTAKAEQAVGSMNTVERWWLDVLRGERDPVNSGLAQRHGEKATDAVFETDCFKDTLFNDYKLWCHDNRRRLDDARVFWRTLATLTGNRLSHYRPQSEDGTRPRLVWFPSREECCTAFAAHVGCPWSDLASYDSDAGEG